MEAIGRPGAGRWDLLYGWYRARPNPGEPRREKELGRVPGLLGGGRWRWQEAEEDTDEGYADNILLSTIPERAVWVRKWASSSSDEENRLSQGPPTDTQLQAWGRGSLGSMKP